MKSIVEGPYQMGTKTVTLAGGVEGLPKDIYPLINHYTDAKDIWDNVKMLLEGSKLTKDDRESQLYDDFEHFCQNKRENIHYYYVRTSSNTRNKATVQDVRVVVQDVRGRYNAKNQGRQFQRNNARGFVRTGNVEGLKGVRNLNPGRAKPIKCYNYNENGAVLDEEQLLFLVGEHVTNFDDDVDDPPEQDLALNVDHVFEGTKSIYQSFVKPYLSKHEAEIDRVGSSVVLWHDRWQNKKQNDGQQFEDLIVKALADCTIDNKENIADGKKYSGDDDFALPYWNWDNPEGMTIPQMFVQENDDDPLFGNKNPLYDVYRDSRHLPPKVVDLFFSGSKIANNFANELESDTQRACNLSMVYKDLIRNATDWKGFFGGEYTAGPSTDKPKPSVGSVESNSHTAVHVWVEPTADDWLNASYVFYDENQNLVRVYNKDSVNIDKLKYDFAESRTPWKNSRPPQRKEKSKELSSALIGEVKTVEEAFKNPAGVEPLLKVRVKRPTKNRSPEEKAKANEILCINGIQFNSNKFVKFDVFVNDKVDINGTLPTACDPEFAGSFAQVPHSGNQQGGMLMPSAARFGLNELLDDTKTEDEEYALVALVARAGCEDLTVSGIEIKDYDMAGDDYEGPSVFDDDQYEEELMLVYDTAIEDVIEEEK
uniref:Putative domain, di-copper centre, polyphenol oxidase n=1 Tax=Tanacetum cinerariifolium TaxID=118510 RepID=A0A6L2NUH5_TANCI|nr:putative domain, di-copper centre, polyphenol oxidase [Tanacetum cinerariifolium]